MKEEEEEISRCYCFFMLRRSISHFKLVKFTGNKNEYVLRVKIYVGI